MRAGRPPRILLSAGEASGDRLGAGLARALRERRPDVELIGMGGEQMARAGVRLIQDAADVSVVGFVEVLGHLGAIRRAMRRLDEHLRRERPDLLVPIDFPDFNLRLAARAKRAAVPVVYYVSPQVWAWRRGRVRTIARLVRRMLVLFPFETEIYEQAGVPVSHVGYPVGPLPRPQDRAAVCSRVGLDPQREVLALLPGSRRIEVSRQLPTMIEAAARVQRSRPGLQVLVPLAPGLSREWLLAAIGGRLGELHVHGGDFPEVLGCCRAGVVAAGTATLEAALAELPTVVVYRISLPSYLVGRALVRLEHYALPNLITGQRLVPELIQGEFTVERLETEIRRYLEHPEEERRVRAALGEVRRRLGEADAFGRAADAVLAELAAGAVN